MRRGTPALAVFAIALIAPAGAPGHAERQAFFPDHTLGGVPKYRTSGPSVVVCKSDSRRRIRRRLSGALERKNLRLLRRCRYRHIQAAVDAARNGYRILVLPGVYREEPSRAAPDPDPRCQGDYEQQGLGLVETGIAEPREGGGVPNYDYHRKCKNSQNLIAIVGDGDDPDRRCDDKCNIQLEGTGKYARHVQIIGDRRKLNVIRADRADGVHLRNFQVQYSDFNNIYALETNGFRFEKIVSRWSREYGFLSFTSDNGLYTRLVAYGSGDSGIYPGSGPEGHCARYGIEIKKSNSYGNTIGYSGTAGNGVWAHDNRFHHNAAGMTTDSFASGHPGMPQDCAKWESNFVYSNNLNLFNAERDEYCKRPAQERDPKIVCPTFQVPIGTGMLIAGGNGNIVRNNWIYDNWRDGVRLFWVPAAGRGEPDPTLQYDTSHSNQVQGNRLGVRPVFAAVAHPRRQARRRGARRRARRGPAFTGRHQRRLVRTVRDPNGVDLWWDEENGYEAFPLTPGLVNCWSGNTGPGGAPPTSDPASLPSCPSGRSFSPGSTAKQASQVSCATWDPHDNTDPPGCDWFTRPSEPR